MFSLDAQISGLTWLLFYGLSVNVTQVTEVTAFSRYARLGPTNSPCRGSTTPRVEGTSRGRRQHTWPVRIREPMTFAAMDFEEIGPDELRLFNTEGRKKQPFRPQQDGHVKFYSCGPTVYDSAHIGNFRAFLTYDVLKRWLLHQGFKVDHVCNLTDVDDKIIRRMERDGRTLTDLTTKYASLFFEDLASLNILPASHYPRATEHIADIVDMIQGLMKKGLAYEMNGSIYFRVASHKRYGALANLDFSGMQDGASEGGGISDADEYDSDKESAKDFALWKAYKNEDGDVFWETPLGKGRPGWHIECSAMARRYLGDTIDVHAGGIDLVFPHHENEIAQSEGFSGKQFCACWVHNAFVNVASEKMSKSKGNFLTLRAALESAIDVRAFRYLVVTSQYRTALNFSREALGGAKNTVKRLDKFRAALEACTKSGGAGEQERDQDLASTSSLTPTIEETVSRCVRQFRDGMNDDLNTPRASAALFALVKAGETALNGRQSGPLSAKDAVVILSALDKMDDVFGIFYEPAGFQASDGSGNNKAEYESSGMDGTVCEWPDGLAELLKERLEAREAKDWATADDVREKIKAMGFAVKDVKGGDPIVTKL